MPEKKKPKYQIIEDYLLERINSNELRPGDQIETEMELSQKFNIGRLTVNKALNYLANAGYIERIAGKGSFVLASKVHKSINNIHTINHTGSFSEDMRSIGMTPGSKLIEYKIILASEKPDVAAKFHLDPDKYIHYFVRIRTGNGIPIALSYTYLSVDVVPTMDIRALDSSLNDYLLKINVPLSRNVDYTLSACLPTEKQKELLNIDDKAVLLCNAHTTYTKDLLPYEYIQTYYLGNHYEYSISVRENTSL